MSKRSFRARALSLAAGLVAVMLALPVMLIVADHGMHHAADQAAVDRAAAALASTPSASQPIAELRIGLQRNADGVLVNRLLLLGGGGVVLLGLALLVAWRIARAIETGIDSVRDDAARLAAGDLSRPVRGHGEGAAGDIAASLESLRETLLRRESAARWLDIMLDSMSDAVLVTSPDGRIKRVNAAATELIGWSLDELLGRDVATLVAEQDRERFNIEQASQETGELTIRTRAGQTIPVSLSGSRLVAPDPQYEGCLFVARNITERKRAERRIRYLARYDSLTKIPNRMQFQHSLQQAIARARRSGRALALLYIDLDRFKEVNDTFGHAAGDRALEILSERLIAQLPKETMLGRLAGDEFGLFIENLDREQDNRPATAAIARELLEQIARPFHLGTHELYVSASIGIAFCPGDADNVVDLIRDADAAMYHSKQNGGNSHTFYTADMSAVAVERLMLKSKLRRAIERDELVMLYQPKVDLRDGRLVGSEALLRWRLPGHGDIPPLQFIPLAEESNLILDVGAWVLKRVCRDYRRWQDEVPDPGRVSINLSLKQLRQAEFIPRFRSVFHDYGVSPNHFELEITETTLMTDAPRMVRLLDELRAMGVHLSIDDFGTGYSSLASLQQFPVGTLKIDQTFVRHATVSRDDAALVRTIIEMGRNLNLEVLAEGIETIDQLAFLRGLGCHYGQGQLFGEAMSADDLLALLRDQARGERRFATLFA
jgi:diguanylate cyclase (GGDEF)-like protein/PAS domain S-box-containing protein